MTLRIATCAHLPEVDVDMAPLADALTAAGIAFDVLAWDDPAVDWDERRPTVIRSTWNYAQNLPAFEAWIDRVDAAGPLFNPASVIRGNLRKRYLLELAARGVPVVPTTIVDQRNTVDLTRSANRCVIKPEVGAGSWMTQVFDPGDPAADAHLAQIVAGGGAALVQPYIASVDGYGERSLVWIDGEISHAIRKSPRFSGDRESVTGPHPIADDERAVATAALAPIADTLLYARVDLARDDGGRPMVMELELVEPSLFFTRGHGAVRRYIDGLVRRLGTASADAR